jgi:hypothetical protein
MLRKDYIVRQFEEFGKFIALVFGLKKDGKWSEIEKLINDSSEKFTSARIEEVEQREDENLLAAISSYSDSQLKMLGDLLYEKGLAYAALVQNEESTNAFRKALLIYEHIQQNALEADFSLDMHFKIKAIKQLL